MTQDHRNARLDKLEILFAEQEYTIETLNTIVTRQSVEISQLTGELEIFRQQLKDMKKQIPENPTADDKPPHY